MQIANMLKKLFCNCGSRLEAQQEIALVQNDNESANNCELVMRKITFT